MSISGDRVNGETLILIYQRGEELPRTVRQTDGHRLTPTEFGFICLNKPDY
jgi:hypothetical protein